MKEKNMKNNSIVSPRLQKAIKKLAADEYFSAQYYMLAPFAVTSDQYQVLCDLFQQFEGNARLNRFGNLVKWLIQYGIDIPCNETELKKCATPNVIKKSSTIKKNQDANFYLSQAKEIEEISMKAYKDIIDIDEVAYFTDLQSLLWQNYYDRADNINKIQSTQIAFDASCDLIMN